MLGDKCVLYNDYDDLIYKFSNAKDIIKSKTDWNAYGKYNPQSVMEQFNNIFLR